MNRRGFLAGLIASGTVMAGDLWIPGQKLISIPSGKVFHGPSLFELLGKEIRYVGPEDKTATVNQLYNWLLNIEDNQAMIGPASNMHMVHLSDGYCVENPEHLIEGSLAQDRQDAPEGQNQREYWSCVNSLGEDVIVADKVYQPHYSSLPRERIREDEDGLKGWR